MILLHLKTALRNLARQRLVTAINLFGLTVGMTASVLIFLWVRNELSYDNDQKNGDRIFRLTTHLEVNPGEFWNWETTPQNLTYQVQKELPGIEAMGSVTTGYEPIVQLKGGPLFRQKNLAYVDKGWFDLFRYDVISGSLADFLGDPRGLVLTESLARKYAVTPGAIVTLDSVPCTVRAIVHDIPSNSSFQFPILQNRLYRLQDPQTRKDDASWGNFSYVTFLRIIPGTDLKGFGQKVSQIFKTARKQNETNHTYFTLDPLRNLHFETGFNSGSFFPHGERKMVYIFSVLGIILLGIACINYVNLTTARASQRAKEVGVRKVMGAGKGSLFLQFLTESALVSICALFLSALLVRLLLPPFDAFTGIHFEFSLTSGPLWMVLLGTLGATILLNSIYPALLLSSFEPTKVLRGNNVLQVKDGTLRKVLVIVQFSITLVLLAGTIVVSSQMRYVRLHSPQYEASNLFKVRIPPGVWKAYHYDFKKLAGLGMSIRNELLARPTIADVSNCNDAIIDLTNSHTGNIDWPGKPKDFDPEQADLITDSVFLRLFHLQMKEGRWLHGYEADDPHHFILNETAVNEFHMHAPVLGQTFYWHGDTGQIVGVVKDFHFRSFHDKITPLIIGASNGSSPYFIVRAGEGQSRQALKATQAVWQQFFPGDPFDYAFLKDTFETLYKTDLDAALLFQVFSWVAILISALGLFGLVSFMAAQRTREIGIRKVLGASVTQLVTLLSRDFITLVGLATLMGIPIAWWASHAWLQGFAYRIDLGWWIFALAALISGLVAMLTVGAQALKSAGANPVHSLRTE